MGASKVIKSSDFLTHQAVDKEKLITDVRKALYDPKYVAVPWNELDTCKEY